MQNKNMGRHLRNKEFSLSIELGSSQVDSLFITPTEILLEALCERRQEAMNDIMRFQHQTANETDPIDYDDLREAVVSGELAESIDEIVQCNRMIADIAHNLSVMVRDAIHSSHVEEQEKSQQLAEELTELQAENKRLKQELQPYLDLEAAYTASGREVGDKLQAQKGKIIYPDLLVTMLSYWQRSGELTNEQRPTLNETKQIGQLISFLSTLQTHYSIIEDLEEKARNGNGKESAATANSSDEAQEELQHD